MFRYNFNKITLFLFPKNTFYSHNRVLASISVKYAFQSAIFSSLNYLIHYMTH
jgi:hypothetical protein